jgi:hypothetical protein
MDGNDENLAFDDSLNHAIRDALRVEVDEHQVAQMEQHWRTEVRREKWRRNALQLCTAAAATVAIATALVLVRSRGQDQEVAQPAKELPSKVVVTAPISLPRAVDSSQDTKSSPSAGRPATAYEQLMFASRSGINVHPTATKARIDAAIQRVAADANADAVGIVASTGVKPANAENLLLRRLPNATAHDRQAIVKLLSVCGSRRSVPALLRVAEHEVAPTGALAAIEQIVGIDGLAQAVGGSKDPTVRSDLMLRLLRSGSQEGLIGFLSLVHNDSTRAEALAVAKSMPEVPIPELITLLDHEDEQVRLAAAITVGYVNGPKTTQLLISRVTEQPAKSPEAWIALMSCRGDMARDFLAYATRRPQLLGYYNNARVHWAQMIP